MEAEKMNSNNGQVIIPDPPYDLTDYPVPQVGLELTIFLSQPTGCGDYKHALPCMAKLYS
jgi:hypothetical protein